jgi:hypothetical protein
VSEQTAADLSKSASGGDGAPEPPAANQEKAEPVGNSPESSAAAGSSSRASQDQGEAPRAMETDDVRGAANTAEAATMPASATGGVPTPGDSKGVAVPSVQAAAGSSEESESVDGVKITALAPPGKPDGEVDTRA